MNVFPRLFTLLLVLLSASAASAQLTVETQTNPLILAQRIVGEGVTITNAQYKGGSLSAATFSAIQGSFPLKSGIILSSGRAKTVGNEMGVDGMANYGGGSQASHSYTPPVPGDPDLTGYSGKSTYDAAVLEFDFIPQGDSIIVRYVFGSEEYPQYTCTRFNDVFAFLITGPGFATPTNIALVPGTNIPVAINSINDGIPGPSGDIDTCRAMGGVAPYTQYYVTNNGGIFLTYNGRTVVLTAKAKVQPCQVYHIKLAVADAFDEILDSGVFIEAGSFSSKPEFKPTLTGALLDAEENVILGESCLPAQLKITRAENTEGPFTVNITYGGIATPGIDFTQLPSQLVFSATENEKTFSISAIADALNEGQEKAVLYFSKYLTCTQELSDSIVFYIQDSMVVRSKTDTITCSNDPVIIKSRPPVVNTTNTYLWNTGSTTQSIAVTQSGTYFVSHTYAQTCTNVDTFVVQNMDPTLSIPNTNPFVCEGSPATLSATTNADSIRWNTGATTASITTSTPGQYWVRVKNVSGCIKSDTIDVSERPSPDLDLGADTAVCPGESIDLDAFHPGASYLWNTGSTASVLTANSAGSYFVTSTLNGCIARDTINIGLKKVPVANAGKDVIMVQNTSVRLSAALDSNNASYLWSPAFTLSNPAIPDPVASPSEATEYTVRVTSVDGCIGEDKIWVTIQYPLNIPNAFSPNGDNINDKWRIGNIHFYPQSTVYIFNRYGQEMFRSTGYKQPWDGTFKGKPLEPATYYYVIEPGDGRRFGGWVVLLK